MKLSVALVAIAALFANVDGAVLKTSRSSLNIGYATAGDRLLYRTYIYQPGVPNAIQYQDITYRGNVTTRITALQVNEVGYTLYATPTLLRGGVGYNNVTVRVTSARGYGYYYVFDVWGR